MTKSEGIPPEVRQDFQELMDVLLPFAEQMLKKYSEFHPFGAFMKKDGVVAAAAGYEGDEHPNSQSLIELLTEGFRDQAARGELKATGICYDARIIPPGKSKKVDAIAMDLEHVLGMASVLFIPYHKGLFKRIRLGELFATADTPKVFPGAGDKAG